MLWAFGAIDSNMKNDPLTGILTVALVAATLGTAAMFYKYLVVSREFRFFQEQVVQVNQRKALANNLSIELNEYSAANPAIKPLLEQMTAKMRSTTNIPSR
jgi:hypothetical protein